MLSLKKWCLLKEFQPQKLESLISEGFSYVFSAIDLNSIDNFNFTVLYSSY